MCPYCGTDTVTVGSSCGDAFPVCPSCDWGINECTEGVCGHERVRGVVLLSVRKPPQVVATATSRVMVNGAVTRDTVIDFGLRSMREDRSSLFGYGIRSLGGVEILDSIIHDREVIVYGHRD